MNVESYFILLWSVTTMIEKYNVARRCLCKKLQYKTAGRIVFLNAWDLEKDLNISRSYAYRLIKNPNLLSARHREIIDNKRCGQISGFDPGWYIDDGKICDPSGFSITQTDLENLRMLKESGELMRMVSASPPYGGAALPHS